MGVNVSADGVKSVAGTTPLVLVLDGDGEDRKLLTLALSEAGYEAVPAATLAQANELAGSLPFDAVVVDPDLPDGNGMELIWSLTLRGALIFVTARDADDRAADRAYARGATDFSSKPILKPEWLARVRRAIADRQRMRSGEVASRLELFHDELICRLDGEIYALTPHERDLLACLLDAPNHFATYEQIMDLVWRGKNVIDRQHVRVLVAQTRRKLESPGAPPLIMTVTGEGLKLSL